MPIVGAAFDILNAGISFVSGQHVAALMNLASAVPGLGDAFAAGKMAFAGAKVAAASFGAVPLAFARGGIQQVSAKGLNSFTYASTYGIASYKSLKAQTKGAGVQVHHLIEQRFAETLGLKQQDMASIVLTRSEHTVLTGKWRKSIGYRGDKNPLTTANAKPKDIMAAAREIYADYPEILRALRL